MAGGVPSRSIYGWLAIFAIAGVGGAGAWYYYWGEDSARYAFDTAPIDRGLIEQSVSATGAVQALTTVDLSSQLSGQIAEVLVDFNSRVKAGDLLAALDKKTFEAKVKSAEANLAMATSSVEVQEATIQKNKALAKNAQDNLARQEQLAERGAASQAILDAARTALATAEADLAVAVAQLANANASVAQRQSDLEQARIDLEHTEIRSPIEGVVIARKLLFSFRLPAIYRKSRSRRRSMKRTSAESRREMPFLSQWTLTRTARFAAKSRRYASAERLRTTSSPTR